MQTQTYHLRISEGRRIVLPLEVCRKIGFDVGETITLRVEDNRATLQSVDRTIQRFQQLVAENVASDVSLVDDLISEREGASLLE